MAAAAGAFIRLVSALPLSAAGSGAGPENEPGRPHEF